MSGGIIILLVLTLIVASCAIRYHGNSKGFTAIPQNIPTNCTRIYLYHNSISTVPSKIFSEYSKVQYLRLSYNLIADLHPMSFSGLSSLSYLDLGHNQLTIFPDLKVLKHSLTSLFLSYNQIVYINHINLLDLYQLQYLYLTKNHVNDISNFTSHANLKSLYINENQINYISNNAFTSFPKSHKLDLSDNPFNQSKITFSNLYLIFLNLRYIVNTTIEVSDLPNLKYMYVNYGNLGKSIILSRVPNLYLLDLSYSNMNGMWPDLSAVKNTLTILKLRGNDIDELNNTALSMLKSLNTLYLDHNLLSSPLDIAFMDDIKYIHLSHNQLTEAPEVYHLKTLVNINLRNNPIIKYNITFPNSIIRIYLQSSGVQNIDYIRPDIFQECINLHYLYFTDSNLTYMPQFGEHNNIVIYLTANKLHTIQESSLRRVKSGIILLGRNPINCDQRLCWIIDSPLKFVYTSCRSPPRLINKYINDLTPQDLHCPGKERILILILVCVNSLNLF